MTGGGGACDGCRSGMFFPSSADQLTQISIGSEPVGRERVLKVPLGLNRSEVKVTNRHKALGGTLQLHKLQHLLLELLLELLDHLHPPSAGGGST